MQLVLGREIEIDLSRSWHDTGPVFGDPRLAPYRLAQQAFQAAHIRPVTEGGENRIDNRLLLRSDVHTMFDKGYLAVDPSYRLRVSPRLRDEFGNGEQFYTHAGQVIALPPGRSTGRSAGSWSGSSTRSLRHPDTGPPTQTVTSLDGTMVNGNGIAARYSSLPVTWAVCWYALERSSKTVSSGRSRSGSTIQYAGMPKPW